MGSKDMQISPQLLNSKDWKFRNTVTSEEGGHNYAFSYIHIVLWDS
jgi:hypothetical protein